MGQCASTGIMTLNHFKIYSFCITQLKIKNKGKVREEDEKVREKIMPLIVATRFRLKHPMAEHSLCSDQ